MAGSEKRAMVRVSTDGSRLATYDTLTVEEPLEIRVAGAPIAVTMRTPGNDFELATGFLFTEGLVDDPSQVRELRYCVGEEEQQYNVLSARLAAGAPGMAAAGIRNFTTSSSCGLCGKARIDDVIGRRPVDVRADTTKFAADVLSSLPDRLRESQRVFADTGGLHAAGLFEATGHLVCAREDVGRHNAFDKVIGWAGMERRLPLTGHVFLASGRASFELVQKALLAGAPALAAVSAPSSLAVALAEAAGMTLVGFLRHGGMNVYAGDWRVT